MRRLLKYFLILSAIFLIIFNWRYIDWFFNYNTIGENISYFTRKTIGQNDVSINTASDFLATTSKSIVIDKTKSNRILIAKIGVNAPISFIQLNSQKIFASLLKFGVLHYPNSVLPGEVGTAIILGHSAPPGWPKINYDSVFNNLKDLKPRDEILINFNGQNFKYLIKKTFWVKKGGDLTPYLTFNKSMLFLISCWPPGHNVERIIVEAELE